MTKTTIHIDLAPILHQQACDRQRRRGEQARVDEVLLSDDQAMLLRDIAFDLELAMPR